MDAALDDMERALELQVKGHVREIDKMDEEVIENAQGRPSAMDGYRKTLESVADVGSQSWWMTLPKKLSNVSKQPVLGLRT